MPELSDAQLAAYAHDGFVRLDEAIPRDVAAECREFLWTRLDEDPDDPSTWTRPSVRIFDHGHPVLAGAARSPRWVAAIGEVAGPDAEPLPYLSGTTVVRFPIEGDPGDDGWHVDGGYAGADGSYRVNHRSKDKALLMLVLFSEIGDDDAPTRLRVGSHRLMTDVLRPFGDEGMAAMEFRAPDNIDELPIALATGQPGDVYLCHPFLVHAAQRNRGTRPRFLSQPSVPWRAGIAGFPETEVGSS